MNYYHGQICRVRILKDTEVVVTHAYPHSSTTIVKAGDEYPAIVIMAGRTKGEGTPTFDFAPEGHSDMATVDFESYPDCFEVLPPSIQQMLDEDRGEY